MEHHFFSGLSLVKIEGRRKHAKVEEGRGKRTGDLKPPFFVEWNVVMVRTSRRFRDKFGGPLALRSLIRNLSIGDLPLLQDRVRIQRPRLRYTRQVADRCDVKDAQRREVLHRRSAPSVATRNSEFVRVA